MLQGEARAEAGAGADVGAESFVYTRRMTVADILAPRLRQGFCDVFPVTFLLMKIVALRVVEHVTGAYIVIFRADALYRGRHSDRSFLLLI